MEAPKKAMVREERRFFRDFLFYQIVNNCLALISVLLLMPVSTFT